VDGRNWLLTLAAYLTAALLVILISCWAIFRYGTAPAGSEMPAFHQERDPAIGMTRVAPPAPLTRQDTQPADAAARRIRLLESMLATKTERLREQAQLLAERSVSYEQLRRRYDEVMTLVAQMLERDSAADPRPVDVAATPSDDAAKLEAELNIAKIAHETLVGDLETMQDELAEIYAEMGRLREEKERTSADRLRDDLVLEAAAALVLHSVGQSAVPALRQALNHQSPTVRRWAASMLGGIGPDAGDAVGDLTEALSDSDPTVRNAARTALEAIGR